MSTKHSLSELLQELAPGKIKILHSGESLFLQGDPTLSIFVVLSGKIRMVRYTVEGYPVTVQTSRAGESFAEASLFSKHYHCNAIADTPSEILCYLKNDILKALSETPEQSQKLMACFAIQVQSLRTRLELRNIRSAHERIFQYLLGMANPSKEIWVESSFKDLAHELGLAHETFYRALRTLEKKEMIQRDGKKILLRI